MPRQLRRFSLMQPGRWPTRCFLAIVFAVGCTFCINGLCQSTRVSPDQTLLARAKQAELAHDFAAAAALYQKYLKQLPRDADVLQRLGLVEYLSGRFQDAIPALNNALKVNPSLWGSDLFLGISYYRLGRFDAAIQPLRRALALKPEMAEAEFWLGATFLAKGKSEPAISDLRQASANPQISLQADSLLVDACERAAESYFDQVRRLAPDSDRTLELRAEELESRGNSSGAILEYERALQRNPDLEGAHRVIGELYWKQRAFDRAAEQFQAERRLDPADATSNLRLGEYWLAKGNSRRAVGYLHSALAAHTPDPAEAWHFTGIAELALNDYSAAESALKQAIRAAPKNPSNYLLLSRLYQGTGRTALAEQEQTKWKVVSHAENPAR